MSRIQEPRIRRVLAPVLAGILGTESDTYLDDLQTPVTWACVRRKTRCGSPTPACL